MPDLDIIASKLVKDLQDALEQLQEILYLSNLRRSELWKKTKMGFKKATDDITDAITTGKDKIIKSLDKMKDPK